MAYANGSDPMIQYLDKIGVKFEKDGSGDTMCARSITWAPMCCPCRKAIM